MTITITTALLRWALPPEDAVEAGHGAATPLTPLLTTTVMRITTITTAMITPTTVAGMRIPTTMMTFRPPPEGEAVAGAPGGLLQRGAAVWALLGAGLASPSEEEEDREEREEVREALQEEVVCRPEVAGYVVRGVAAVEI